ncbi:hypothetical protein NKH13_29120 [Mesorhizobium sp. M1348]
MALHTLSPGFVRRVIMTGTPRRRSLWPGGEAGEALALVHA